MPRNWRKRDFNLDIRLTGKGTVKHVDNSSSFSKMFSNFTRYLRSEVMSVIDLEYIEKISVVFVFWFISSCLYC